MSERKVETETPDGRKILLTVNAPDDATADCLSENLKEVIDDEIRLWLEAKS